MTGLVCEACVPKLLVPIRQSPPLLLRQITVSLATARERPGLELDGKGGKSGKQTLSTLSQQR